MPNVKMALDKGAKSHKLAFPLTTSQVYGLVILEQSTLFKAPPLPVSPVRILTFSLT